MSKRTGGRYAHYFKFGTPQLLRQLDKLDPDGPAFYADLMRKSGRHLVDYWNKNVTRFFRRSRGSYMTKTGKISFNMRRKPTRRRVMQNAIEFVKMADYGVYAVAVKNVRIRNHGGGPDFEIIWILKKGALPSKGAFIPTLGKRSKYGKWRGFTKNYWMRWARFFEAEVSRQNAHILDEMRREITRSMNRPKP